MKTVIHMLIATSLLVATSVFSNTWSLSGMIEGELIPTLHKQSQYDFSNLRGEQLRKAPQGTMWDSNYRPSGPQTPFLGTVTEMTQEKNWVWSVTLPVGGEGIDVFNTIVGSFATHYDKRFGGLGWKASTWGGPGQANHGVSWEECPTPGKGRNILLQRIPGSSNSKVVIQFIRYFDKTC
ncbi:MAG: hypothetical protein CMI09_07320 [Oceanospirillaceae bacterium]|nr:hypothetical protein [Oceanospirillaceae bacterium]